MVGYFDGGMGSFLFFVFCFLFWIGLEGWVFGSVVAVGVMF